VAGTRGSNQRPPAADHESLHLSCCLSTKISIASNFLTEHLFENITWNSLSEPPWLHSFPTSLRALDYGVQVTPQRAPAQPAAVAMGRGLLASWGCPDAAQITQTLQLGAVSDLPFPVASRVSPDGKG